jgi:hypothetical protein
MASAMGQELIVLDISSDREIETALATLVQRGAGALHAGIGRVLAIPTGMDCRARGPT